MLINFAFTHTSKHRNFILGKIISFQDILLKIRRVPAAQRRLAGEPKASPDIFLSSRIYARSCLKYWWFERRRKPTSLLALGSISLPFSRPPCPMYQSAILRPFQNILAQPPPQGANFQTRFCRHQWRAPKFQKNIPNGYYLSQDRIPVYWFICVNANSYLSVFK